jgi:hypothetical protein
MANYVTGEPRHALLERMDHGCQRRLGSARPRVNHNPPALEKFDRIIETSVGHRGPCACPCERSPDHEAVGTEFVQSSPSLS